MITGSVKKNGLFGSITGGSCEDYNCIEVMLRLLAAKNYQINKITKIIENTQKTILRNCVNGSFSYNFYKEKSIIKRYLFRKNLEKIKYSYSGLEFIKTCKYLPDIWSTYFRILTIAQIERYLNNSKKYKSYHLPAWGYLIYNKKKSFDH